VKQIVKNKENQNQNETEALNHLDPSFINEPSIEKAKKEETRKRGLKK